MPDLPLTKICSRCPEGENVKPVTEFFKNAANKDGLFAYCKACHKKAEARPGRVANRKAYKAMYHVLNAETINTRSAQWQKDNPDRANAKNKRSYTKRRPKVLEHVAAYRAENGEVCSRRQRISRRKKPEHYATKNKIWQQENPNKVAEYQHKRRAHENNIPFIEEVDITVLFTRDNGICGICFKPVRTLAEASRDHIIPVTVEGSEHSYRNMVLAHKSCNSMKGNRTVPQQLRLF